MRALLSIVTLFFISLPAFAVICPGGICPAPEPETLPLLGIGIAGLLLARRNKK